VEQAFEMLLSLGEEACSSSPGIYSCLKHFT